jgi:hypothetical protein
MRKLLIFVVLGVIAWQGYGTYQMRKAAAVRESLEADDDLARSNESNPPLGLVSSTDNFSSRSFKCDGRTYCSQMTSCAEATYFLRNCPGVKMDGGGDGVPCERQWCGDK